MLLTGIYHWSVEEGAQESKPTLDPSFNAQEEYSDNLQNMPRRPAEAWPKKVLCPQGMSTLGDSRAERRLCVPGDPPNGEDEKIQSQEGAVCPTGDVLCRILTQSLENAVSQGCPPLQDLAEARAGEEGAVYRRCPPARIAEARA